MKHILIFIFFLLSKTTVFCQDIIIRKVGEDIKSKIVEVGQTEIKYKKFENIDGPVYVIQKSEIFMIRYQNGSKDVFLDESLATDTLPNNPPKTSSESTPPPASKKPTASTNSELFKNDSYNQGKMDAARYYSGYKGAGTGTFLTSLLLSPLIGLVPAIACSSTKPSDSKLMYPSIDLMKDTDYYNGYTQNAKKIKSRKVWSNWGIAFGINLVLIIALSAE